MCKLGTFKANPHLRGYHYALYHTFFETVFKPYFTSKSPKDVAERRAEFNEVLAAAVAHGMTALSTMGGIDYRWDEKQDSKIEKAPAMMHPAYFEAICTVLAESEWDDCPMGVSDPSTMV